jgi:hypothetical protein
MMIVIPGVSLATKIDGRTNFTPGYPSRFRSGPSKSAVADLDNKITEPG